MQKTRVHGLTTRARPEPSKQSPCSPASTRLNKARVMFLHPPVYVLALLLQIPNTRCICLHLCFLLLPWLKAYCARVASNLSMQRNTGAHICKTCGYDSALTGKQAKVCTGCCGVSYCDRACQKQIGHGIARFAHRSSSYTSR